MNYAKSEKIEFSFGQVINRNGDLHPRRCVSTEFTSNERNRTAQNKLHINCRVSHKHVFPYIRSNKKEKKKRTRLNGRVDICCWQPFQQIVEPFWIHYFFRWLKMLIIIFGKGVIESKSLLSLTAVDDQFLLNYASIAAPVALCVHSSVISPKRTFPRWPQFSIC